MSKASGNKRQMDDDEIEEFDAEEYAELELLERLESLREDMEELKVNSLAEVVERIAELHQRLDSQQE